MRPHRWPRTSQKELGIKCIASDKLMKLIKALKQFAHNLKREVFALYFAARHPETPLYAKLVVAVVVAYAFSPIDLIPDFIPVLGYLDDLILLPIGIALAIKMIPVQVIDECRLQAEKFSKGQKPVNWIAGTVILFIWLIAGTVLSLWLYENYDLKSIFFHVN